MRNPLLNRSSPADLAERGQVIDQKEQIGTFSQLAKVVEADLALLDDEQVPSTWREWPVAIRLRFGWGGVDREAAVVQGHVLVELPATCQRCLAAMQVTLDSELKAQFTLPGESIPAVEGYETWELEEATLRPLDLVEEVLLMALPLVALHAPGDECAVPAGIVDDGNGDDGNEDTTRPFADLRSRIEARGDEDDGGDEDDDK